MKARTRKEYQHPVYENDWCCDWVEARSSNKSYNNSVMELLHPTKGWVTHFITQLEIKFDEGEN